MRALILSALAAVAVLARAQADETKAPGFSISGTGDGMLAYHRLSGDCLTLEHSHGRNAAWGLWRMPLAALTGGQAEDAADGTALVRFSCRDTSACIAQGALSETPDTVAAHEIPFATMDRARAYLDEVSALRAACTAD